MSDYKIGDRVVTTWIFQIYTGTIKDFMKYGKDDYAVILFDGNLEDTVRLENIRKLSPLEDILL